MFLVRAAVVWLAIIGLETIHGILRLTLLTPLVGDFPSRQISVFSGSLLIFAVAYRCIQWIKAESTRQLLSVGLLWVALTVLFEVGLGRIVLRLSWNQVTADYDITQGGLLGIGLLFMASAPWLATHTHKFLIHKLQSPNIVLPLKRYP